MKISLQQAAEIVSLTTDELMFLVQSNKIQASVNQDSLAWEFDLDEVLNLKNILESKRSTTTQEE